MRGPERSMLVRSAALGLLVLVVAPAAASADTTVEAESMRLRPGTVQADGTASAGSSVVLRGRGHAIKTVTTGPVERIVVVARGTSCPRSLHGAPDLVVRIDGRRAFRAAVASSGWVAYTAVKRLSAGRHRLRLSYDGKDRRSRSCNRDLWLDRLTLVAPPARKTAAAPAPRARPPQPAAAFVGDFETGNLAQWTGVQADGSDRVTVVPSPARQGRYAARFEVRSGDSVFGGARAEVQWGNHKSPTLKSGFEHYIGWSTWFDPAYPTPRPGEGDALVMQTHSTRSGGTPEIEISTRSERLILHTKAGDPWSIPLRRGVWHDFMLRVRFSSSPTEGFVELWHNGRKVVTGYHTATLAPGVDSYLKLGLYRSSKIEPTGVVYHDGLRVGGSYAAAELR